MSLADVISGDLATFLNGDDFAVEASFSHSGAASTIKVIFDNDFQAVAPGGQEVESLGPAARCKTSDVSTAVQGDTLTVSGVAYNIIGVHPDGTGITLLILSRDA